MGFRNWIKTLRSIWKDGGEGGIRTHEGSHPAGFQDRCRQPLGYLSALQNEQIEPISRSPYPATLSGIKADPAEPSQQDGPTPIHSEPFRLVRKQPMADDGRGLEFSREAHRAHPAPRDRTGETAESLGGRRGARPARLGGLLDYVRAAAQCDGDPESAAVAHPVARMDAL